MHIRHVAAALDYTAASAQTILLDGFSRSVEVSFTIVDDTLEEGTEAFFQSLSLRPAGEVEGEFEFTISQLDIFIIDNDRVDDESKK